MNKQFKKLATMGLCAVTLLLATGGAAQAATATEPSVTYNTHVQNVGWQNYSQMNTFSGTEGQSLRLEGIHVKLNKGSYDLGIEYQTHIQNIGWEAEIKDTWNGNPVPGWKTSNVTAGTYGRAWRLEGIKIRLTGADADKFDILYKTHIQNVGWEKEWKKNGEMSGTSGQSLRLEGIYIQIVKKAVTPTDPVDPVDPGTGTGTVTDPGDMSWDKNNNGILDDNEKADWQAIPPQNPDPIVVDPEPGHFTENPDYVPWVVNLPVTAHTHDWAQHTSVTKVNGVEVYRMAKINPYSVELRDPEKLYRNDVAKGCKYNFVEWLNGHGNSYFPEGLEKSGKFGNLTVKTFLQAGGVVLIDESVLGHPQSQITNDELDWAYAHRYIDFQFCTICGETKTTY